jgi:hypothetical protein
MATKRRPQHGGKRKGAGRKPGSVSKPSCDTCAILLRQLEAADVREKRLMRQLEAKDQQIGQVITSKFETFNLSGERQESNVGPGLPIETLSGITNYDDSEQFLEKAQEVLYPKTQ